MADNISNIVDPQVMSDLQELIERLINVENEIKTINGQALSVTVDLKGAENLTRLTELMDRQQVTIEKLNTASAEYTRTASQVNQVGSASVRVFIEQKQILGYVNEQIRILNKDLAQGVGNY